MDRRGFLHCLAGVATLATLPGWRLHRPPRGFVVRVQFASAFDAPYVQDRLCADMPLDLRIRSGKTCVFFREKLLGWLPSDRPWDVDSCRLAVIGHDRRGRLMLHARVEVALTQPGRRV